MRVKGRTFNCIFGKFILIENNTLFIYIQLKVSFFIAYLQNLQNLGHVYIETGETDKAIMTFKDAIGRQNKIETPSQEIQVRVDKLITI